MSELPPDAQPPPGETPGRKPPLKERLSGLGLSETLRREKAGLRREKKKAQEVRRVGRRIEYPVHADLAWQEQDPQDSAPPEHPDAVLAEISAGTATSDAQEMAARLYRAFAGQMDRLEARLNEIMAGADAGGETDLSEIDKTVKTLASLAKTLTVLTGLKTQDGAEDGSGDEREDIDALREALAQRLERLGGGGAD